MKIEITPNFTFSNEEVKAADYFCALCKNFDKEISDYWADIDDIETIIHENILMDWHVFCDAAERFASFIHNHREG